MPYRFEHASTGWMDARGLAWNCSAPLCNVDSGLHCQLLADDHVRGNKERAQPHVLRPFVTGPTQTSGDPIEPRMRESWPSNKENQESCASSHCRVSTRHLPRGCQPASALWVGVSLPSGPGCQSEACGQCVVNHSRSSEKYATGLRGTLRISV